MQNNRVSLKHLSIRLSMDAGISIPRLKFFRRDAHEHHSPWPLGPNYTIGLQFIRCRILRSSKENIGVYSMTTEHILAMRSKNGDILLSDSKARFMASYKIDKGLWIADDVFESSDLEYNFSHIDDDAEILRLIAEAIEALEQAEKKAKAG